MASCALIAALTITLLSTGCEFKGGAKTHAAATTQAAWAIRPVKMRVFPTTRFVRDDQDGTLLEARIELMDEMGDSIKGVGQFSFELRSPRRARLPNVGDRLYGWKVAMLTLDDERTAYDPITRTYFFRLKVDDGAVAKHATLLHVVFATPDGQWIESEATVAGVSPPKK